MRLGLLTRTLRGIRRGLRARPGVFWGTAAAVFVLNIVLPVVVLSLARKPVDFFTFNPWLRRLPEWLVSDQATVGRKLEFLANLAIAWFSSNNPVEGVEWGFVIDVPSLARFILTGLLFGAYFALWAHRRDEGRACGLLTRAGRHGGIAGVLTSVLGFTTGPCSVVGCGVPVLPVVGLAITGVESTTLALFTGGSRVAIAVVLAATAFGVAWFGWQGGAAAEPPRRA